MKFFLDSNERLLHVRVLLSAIKKERFCCVSSNFIDFTEIVNENKI